MVYGRRATDISDELAHGKIAEGSLNSPISFEIYQFNPARHGGERGYVVYSITKAREGFSSLKKCGAVNVMSVFYVLD